jgi:hypothetical protein
MASGRPRLLRRSLKQDVLDLWHETAHYEAPSWMGRPGRWLLRVAAVAYLLCAVPLEVAAMLFGERGFRRLDAHAERVRETSPFEAILLVRGIYDQLQAAVRARRLTSFRRLKIPPYGRFSSSAVIPVWVKLYDLEFATGRYEEAYTLTKEMPESPAVVLMRVECLLALKRPDEAISLLESRLHIDWDTSLRARLTELAGHDAGGHN